MKNTYCSIFVIILLTVVLSGCGSKSTYEKEQSAPHETAKTTEPVTKTATADNPPASDVDLNHTYTTRFGEVNLITYPSFSFDYPDGWTITSEEVTPSSEKVILENESGVTVTYWYFGYMRELTGAIRNINSVDVTKISDAGFIPGYVQATDYSDLGRFMVAKLKITEKCDLLGDGESVKVENGRERYALLPESEAGEQKERCIPGLPTFSFWYGGHISLIANAPKGEFTEQEEKEVTAILVSFRDDAALAENPMSAESADFETAETIEKLWTMLQGEWAFEEYIYNNKTTQYPDHTMEFRYVDNIPCMCRDAHRDDGYMPDVIFYEFEVVDESHYNGYTYKKGSYQNEKANWSDDALLAWYSFDLSNISDGELLISYHISFANGFVDNHQFKYKLED